MSQNLRVQWTAPAGYPSEYSWATTGPAHQYEGEIVGFVPGKAVVRVDDFLVEVDISDLKVVEITEAGRQALAPKAQEEER